MKSTRQMIAKEDFDIWIIPPFYLSLIFGSTIQNLFLPRTNNLSFLLRVLYLFKNNISTRKSSKCPWTNHEVRRWAKVPRGWPSRKGCSRGCTQWRREVRERDGVGGGGEKRRSKGRIEGLSTFSPLAMLSWGPSEGLTSGFVISASSLSPFSLVHALS